MNDVGIVILAPNLREDVLLKGVLSGEISKKFFLK